MSGQPPVDPGGAPVPRTRLTLASLRRSAATCTACPLYARATQTVFGEGPTTARVMLLGEQPGDAEDKQGHPFVGPSGRLLDEALENAGIRRNEAYVTNVVKHFKWEPRGKVRLHKKPNGRELAACRPWLDAELAVVKPEAVVLLGATAAQALLGRDFRVTKHRGKALLDTGLAPIVVATVHPSSVLRTPDSNERRRARARFFADLEVVAKALGLH